MKPVRSLILCLILITAATALTAALQIIKTTLTVTVRDDLGNTVEGATVQLFENEGDYTKEQNVAAEGVTDAKGVLRLKDLKAIAYYIIVRKDDKDNAGGGEKTEKLEAKKINKVTIVIQ
jgi:ABC-type Na+ efflux pump permease subunit